MENSLQNVFFNLQRVISVKVITSFEKLYEAFISTTFKSKEKKSEGEREREKRRILKKDVFSE